MSTLKVLEADLQKTIVEAARLSGWLVHHDRPARGQRDEWRTHVQGDVGFPDLVLIHPHRKLMLFWELKSEKGKLTPAQSEWRKALEEVIWELEGVSIQYAIVRPENLDDALEFLQRSRRV